MRLERIAQEFGGRVHFLCVYIKEAHPTDGSQSPANLDDNVLFAQPTTEDERAEVAACTLRHNFSFPMVLDDMTDVVGSTYMAMPERLYVLDAAGRVAWKCGLGPQLFDPDGFEVAIGEQVVTQNAGV